jgi:predicted RNA-binding Zn-ribbon protein involved in translation (DUF1610 family)
VVGGVVLLMAGVVVANYQVKHPYCRNCRLALTAIKLYETVFCPSCGQALTGVEAALA